METPDVRRDAAKQYLALVYGTAGFLRILEFHRTMPSRSVPGLALLHPQWLPAENDVVDFYGPKTFSIGAEPRLDKCRADLLWGYECQLDDQSLESDHLFPYWLGGRTVGGNRVVLCSVHNRMKSGDIHVYPWEIRLPSWAAEAIHDIVERRRVADLQS